LKPTTRSVTLRLPETLLARLKNAANQRDVPYQSLIKIWLAEKLDESEVRRVPIHRPRVQPSIAVFTHPATLRAALLEKTNPPQGRVCLEDRRFTAAYAA